MVEEGEVTIITKQLQKKQKQRETGDDCIYIIWAPTILVLGLIIIVFKLHQSLIAKSTNSQ